MPLVPLPLSVAERQPPTTLLPYAPPRSCTFRCFPVTGEEATQWRRREVGAAVTDIFV